MEYFSLEDDFKELDAVRRKRRWRIICVFAVAAVLLARPAGLFTIELAKASTKETHEYQSIATFRVDDDRLTQKTGRGNMKRDSINSFRQIGFSLGGRLQVSQANPIDDLANSVTKAITKESLGGSGFRNITVSVERLDIVGWYWMPLFKNGTASYRAVAKIGSEDYEFTGNFSGVISFDVIGVCSNDKLEMLLSERIALAVADSIKNEHKK